MEEQKDIFSHFVRTIESATYTEMFLTTGNMNLEGMGIKSTLGQGRQYVSLQQEKDGDCI
jgi:CTP-dependent riboflavin kinase